MEKKNTGLIIAIVVLVVLVLGLGGYVCYDKFYLDKNGDDVSKVDNKNNDNSFDVYAKALKANKVKKMQEDSKNNVYIDRDEYSSSLEDEVGTFYVLLTADGTLSISFEKESLKKYDITIDSNVLFYEMVYNTIDGSRTLYYVKDDGKVYMATPELDVYEQRNKISSKVVDGVKDIVLIRQLNKYDKVGNDGKAHFYAFEFVDINGNIYYPIEAKND